MDSATAECEPHEARDASRGIAQFLNIDMMLVAPCQGGARVRRNMGGRIRPLQGEEWGALEGLPLYLIILVAITAIALVVIIGLLPRPLVPNSMTIDVLPPARGATQDVLCWVTTDQSVAITVFTRDNVAINDAVVHIIGPGGIDATQRTRDGGKTTFVVRIASVPSNPSSATVDVDATFGGLTVTDQIPLNRVGSGGC